MIIWYLPRLLRELFIQRKKLKRAAVPVSKRTKMQNVYEKKRTKSKNIKNDKASTYSVSY